MKNMYKILTSLVFVLGFGVTSFGQQIVLKQTNESGIYKKGERIEVSVLLEGIESDSFDLFIRKNYAEGFNPKKVAYSGGKMILFNEVVNEPTSLIFNIKVDDAFARLGLVVDAENFKPGTKRPKDINRFWKKERKALRALPMKVEAIAIDSVEVGYSCADVAINTTGAKQARGYFAKPQGAKPKSLPIVLFVHAAGVNGSWCLSQPDAAVRYAKMGSGALAFDLNAHGMLNGQSQEYYDDLAKGELKDYYSQGIENKNDYYFKGMYVRLMRALDFLTSQPEWDGERILVLGESQGGGQALIAAGLDKRVSAVVATVPAMCDFGGALEGRTGGWPNPFKYKNDPKKMLATLPYFDAAHLLRNSKATIVTEIGFIDRVCPSMSVYAAINQNKGKNIVYGVPYRAHHLNQKQFQTLWENTVYKPKMDFIENYLK